MSWDPCDYDLVGVIRDILIERNKIERAKLAEMRAARTLQVASFGLDVLANSTIDRDTRVEILGEVKPAQADADRLTLEVLKTTI